MVGISSYRLLNFDDNFEKKDVPLELRAEVSCNKDSKMCYLNNVLNILLGMISVPHTDLKELGAFLSVPNERWICKKDFFLVFATFKTRIINLTCKNYLLFVSQ